MFETLTEDYSRHLLRLLKSRRNEIDQEHTTTLRRRMERQRKGEKSRGKWNKNVIKNVEAMPKKKEKDRQTERMKERKKE